MNILFLYQQFIDTYVIHNLWRVPSSKLPHFFISVSMYHGCSICPYHLTISFYWCNFTTIIAFLLHFHKLFAAAGCFSYLSGFKVRSLFHPGKHSGFLYELLTCQWDIWFYFTICNPYLQIICFEHSSGLSCP